MQISFQLIKKLVLTYAAIIICNILSAQYAVRFEIKNRPSKHSSDSLFIAGNFNGWNAGVKAFAFQLLPDGTSFVNVTGIEAGIIEYKITRGTWSTVEMAVNGSSISNRINRINSDTVISLNIDAWADDFPGRPPVSTRSKNVFIIDTSFFIPQLNRKRRIWVYLPDEYVFTKKRYPVLYMNDGQNLFDAVTSSFGEWGVDEMMDSLRPGKQCIIVGIDHGDSKRLTEYNPYSSRFGEGEGDAYVDFLVHTLKPFIDKTYRTKPLKESTAIAGSSMGGLISLYAVLKYPTVFGGAGIFSPAFWLAPDLKRKIDSSRNNNSAIYFVCGEMESAEMVGDMKKIYEQIKLKGNKKLFFKQVSDGKHNESFWRREMPQFYNWIFTNQMR